MKWSPEVVVTVLVQITGLTQAVAMAPYAIWQDSDLAFGSDSVVSTPTAMYVVEGVVSSLLVPLTMLAVGAYGFLSGGWVIAGLTRGLSDKRRCAKSAYDLSSIEHREVCPKCGVPFPARTSGWNVAPAENE